MNTRFTFSTMDSNANDRYWDVYLDSHLLQGCRATGEDGTFIMFVDSLESWDRLKSVSCDQFRQFGEIFAPAPAFFAPFIKGKNVRLYANSSSGLDCVVVHLSIEAGEWTNPWSINEFIESMKSVIASKPNGSQWGKYSGFSRYCFDFNFKMPITETRATLGDVAGTATTLVRETVTSVSRRLKIAASNSFSSVCESAPSVFTHPDLAHNLDSANLTQPRGLSVFLCHASEDKENARELRIRLLQDGFDPWLDEVKLLPGQEWESEIQKAVRAADVVVVCLSTHSIDKKGFVQREIRISLDAADERPQGSIFLIPACIEECQVPVRLSKWQRVDLFTENGYGRLCLALDAVRLNER